jgi:hypothetical protein
VVEQACLFLGQYQDQAGTVGEALEHRLQVPTGQGWSAMARKSPAGWALTVR